MMIEAMLIEVMLMVLLMMLMMMMMNIMGGGRVWANGRVGRAVAKARTGGPCP